MIALVEDVQNKGPKYHIFDAQVRSGGWVKRILELVR